MKKIIFKNTFIYIIIFSFIFQYAGIYSINSISFKKDNDISKLNSFSNPSISSATSLGNPYQPDTWTSDNVNITFSSNPANNIQGYQYTESSNINSSLLDNYQNNIVLYETNVELEDTNHTGVLIPEDKRNEMKTLEEGTIITQFYTSSGGPSSIISLTNTTSSQDYFQVFVTSRSLGISMRVHDDKISQTNLTLENNKLYNLAIKADKNFGYKFFLNGQKIYEEQVSTDNYRFMHSIVGVTEARIGYNNRNSSYGQYRFLGAINYVSLYNTKIEDDILQQVTTKVEDKWKNTQGNSLNLNTSGENRYIFREVRSNNTARHYNNNEFITKIDRSLKFDTQTIGGTYNQGDIAGGNITLNFSPSYYPEYTSKYQYIASANYNTNILNNYNSNLIFSDTNISFKDANHTGSKLSDMKFNQIKNLDQGTIITQFVIKDNNSDQSILNLYNDDTTTESQFSIYVSPSNNTLTLKIKKDSEEYIKTINQNINTNTIYNLAIQADINYGYRIFLNGQKVSEEQINSNDLKFLNFIDNAKEASIGYNGSSFSNNNLKLVGRVNYLGIYNTVIPENTLTTLTTGSNTSWQDVNNNTLEISNDGTTNYYFREVDNDSIPYNNTILYNFKIAKGTLSPSVELQSNGSNHNSSEWSIYDITANLSSNSTSNSGFQYSDDSVEGLNVLKNYDNNLVYSDYNVDFNYRNHQGKDIATNEVNNLNDLEEGTIVTQFHTSRTTGVETIISLGNDDSVDNNFIIRLNHNPEVFEFWVRTNGSKEYSVSSFNISDSNLHIVALQADKNFGYRVFIDGRLIKEFPITNNYVYKFFKTYQDLGTPLNKGKLGQIINPRADYGYDNSFIGEINLIAIYDTVIPNDDLIKITNKSKNTWHDISGNSMTISTHGHNKYSFREKRDNGIPRLQSETIDMKIDKGTPEILDINFQEITRTHFSKDTEITITANGSHSGIKNIQYQLTTEDGIPDNTKWLDYDSSNKPVISKYFKGVVLARVINNANVVSDVERSTNFEVDIINISMPMSLTFSVYDNNPGNPNGSITSSSPNYHIVNNSNRPIEVVIKETSANSDNNVIMVNSTPTAENQLKLDITPSTGFFNQNNVTLRNGTINEKLGYLDYRTTNGNDNKGYFNLDITTFSQLPSQKYTYSYNTIFEFNPLHFISVEVIGNGTVTGGNKYVSNGENVVLQITPDNGYIADRIYLDGVLVGDNYPQYTLKDIQESHNIKVVFKRKIPNLSIGATATSNSENTNGYHASKAIDGLSGTRWASYNTGSNRYLELDYGQEQELNHIIIKEYTEKNSQLHHITKSGHFIIEYWDGSNWIELFNLATDRNNPNKCDFTFIEYIFNGSEISQNNAIFNPDIDQYAYSTVDIKFKTPIRTQKIKYTVTNNSKVSLYEFETYNTDFSVGAPFKGNNNNLKSNKIENTLYIDKRRKYVL